MTSTQRHDTAKWTVEGTVAKWTPDQVARIAAVLGHEPTAAELLDFHEPELVCQHGNMLLTAGLALVMNRLVGTGSTQAVDNTHTRLGVGSSNTAEAVGQTDLQAAAGSANRWFQTMDATYPSVAGGVLTARATFGASDANFTWNEWGLDISTSTATASATVATTLLNRKVAPYGTKVSGAVWQFTVTLTLA